tara:strand:- start:99 stop:1088 length:990 start_codon:yes stop_codon:yes gene_type:complete
MTDITNIPPNTAIEVDDGDRFKIAQAIYNSVTGKTEKLSRSFGKNYIITADDIKQLHMKCEQACSQWEILQKNSSITVHHLDDNKEIFSSTERFSVYDASRTSATESIVYESNILIRLPNVEKPQPYKITVRLLSKVSLMKRMESQMAPPPFLRFFTAGNIVTEVDFVDYVVARNMQSVIESWVDEIEIESKFGWIEKVQKYTHWIPQVSHFSIVLLFGVTLFQATPTILIDDSKPALLAQWLILAGTTLFLSGILARILGRMAESGIDRVMTISSIQLNKGDKKLLENFKKRNIWRALQATLAIGLIISQGVAVGLIIDNIKSLINGS